MEEWRVAQLLVDRPQGEPEGRGSGYLVAPGRVLTAAHVLTGAVAVTVLLDAGKGEIRVTVERGSWWADPDPMSGCDLAVITLPDAAGVAYCAAAMFGRIGEAADGVIQVQAVGFPLHKLCHTAAPGGAPGAGEGETMLVRDTEHVIATAPLLANRRQGTLAVCLSQPSPSAREKEDGGWRSPWEGFSGAAVWANGRIVAVVTRNHEAEGPGRLAASRIDRAYDRLPGHVRSGLGLPERAADLADVVPPSAESVIQSVYQVQARGIAPGELIGRKAELEDWIRFCAGPEAYVWWHAEPFTGKSALASWFVAHPPGGLDVISFFVTRGLAGQADSEAFFHAVVEQLRAYLGLDSYAVADYAPRGAFLSLLLERAAELAGEREKRLVLVVDGLDEDEGGADPRSSIASLLPWQPPGNLRVIVTSRPGPDVLAGVDDDHPLGACRRVELPRIRVSNDLECRAKRELSDLFAAADQDPLAIAVHVVGYVAAHSGGLTEQDLQALIDVPPFRLTPVLSGVVGRSLRSQPASHPRQDTSDRAPRVYLFAHEILREQAERELGAELGRYRARIHDWVDGFRAQGWPDDTPAYAIYRYPGMLGVILDVGRLTRLATDPWRHQWLRHAAAGDADALREIKMAQDAVWSRAQASLAGVITLADLTTLANLAACRDDLIRRNESIPAKLPALWLRLGGRRRAEALFGAMVNPQQRADAQAAMARAEASVTVAQWTPSNEYQEVQALAKEIESATDESERVSLIAKVEHHAGLIADSYQRADALAVAIKAMAGAGLGHRAKAFIDTAEALAFTVPAAGPRVQVTTALVRAIAAAGYYRRAEALARGLTDPDAREQVLAVLVTSLAGQRAYGRAEALAMTGTDIQLRGRALTQVAVAIDANGPSGPARALRLASRIDHPYWRAQALLELASAAISRGHEAQARKCLRQAGAAEELIEEESSRNKILTFMATTLARTGDHDAARRVARRVTGEKQRAYAVTELAKVAAGAGHADRAAKLARSIGNPYYKALAMSSLVPLLASRHRELARRLARELQEPAWQGRSLTALARELARTGDESAADAIAHEIPAAEERTVAYAALIRVTDPANLPRTASLADLAVASSESIGNRQRRADALTEVADAAADSAAAALARELAELAEQVARGGEDGLQRVRELCLLARARSVTDGRTAAASLAAIADRRAQLIHDPQQRLVALFSVASTASAIGDQAGALAVIRSIVEPCRPGRPIATLAEKLAEADCHNLAEQLASSIGDPRWRAQALATLALCAAARGRRKPAKALAEQACEIVTCVIDPVGQVRILSIAASAMAESGRQKRAVALRSQADATASGIRDAAERARAMDLLTRPSGGPVADRDTEAGPPGTIGLQQARPAVAEQVRSARGLTSPYHRAKTLATIAAAADSGVDVYGLISEADMHADTITDPRRHADVLQTLASAAAAAGDVKRCRQLGKRAASLIPPTAGPDWPVEVQRGLVRIATAAGAHDLAYAIAWAPRDPRLKADLLRAVGKALAEAGRAERALAIAPADGNPGQLEAGTAERAAPPGVGQTPSSGPPVHQAARQPQTSTAPVRALIADGKLTDAEELARLIPDADLRVQAFTALVSANAAAGRQSYSRDLAVQAAQWAETLTAPHRKARVLAALTEAVGEAGDLGHMRQLADRTEALAADLGAGRKRADVLTCLIRAMARTGDYRRCRELARGTGPELQDGALAEAVATAAAHDLNGVLTLAGYIGDPSTRGGSLVAAARCQQEPDEVRGLVAAALRYGSWSLVLNNLDGLPRDVIAAVADFVPLRPGASE